MKNYFKELFDYSLEHDRKLIRLFHQHPDMLKVKSGELFDHILNAHQIWNFRILEKEKGFGVWQRHSIENMDRIALENYSDSMQILNTKDIEVELTYQDSKGNSYRNRIKDILFHVINHGTYHRGQIALEFRRAGIDPIVSDFIFYKR